MHDLVRLYEQFQEDRKPPSIPVASLYARMKVPPVGFQFMMPDQFVSAHYVRKLSDLQALLQRETASLDAELKRADSQFRKNPPPMLLAETELGPEDLGLLRRLVSADSLDSASRVQTIIRDIDDVTARDIEAIASLHSAIRSVTARQQIDPKLKAIGNLNRLSEQAEQLRERSTALLQMRNRFVSLTSSISFQVRSIRMGIATVSLPFPAQLATVRDSMQAHVQAAAQQRQKHLIDEVDDICAHLPQTRIDESRIIMTFGTIQQGKQFRVVFQIRPNYPWVRLTPEIEVQLGNAKVIARTVTSVCKRVPWVRNPLLVACRKIIEECQLSV
jgi:hypothetical protein